MKIGVLMGDDIGYEVVPECTKVLAEAAACAGLNVEWVDLPIGKEGHEGVDHRPALQPRRTTQPGHADLRHVR